MKTIELMKHKDKSLLVILRDDDTVHEYVIATNHWDYAYYSLDFQQALNYWNVKVLCRPTYNRLSELATYFKDGLIEDDEETAMEYFEEACEMTESEKEWFGIIESEDEDYE